MKTLLRAISALLALAAGGLTVLRLYAVAGSTGPVPGGPVDYGLRLLFPATMALFFGYLALKGRLPFYRSPLDEDRPGGGEGK